MRKERFSCAKKFKMLGGINLSISRRGEGLGVVPRQDFRPGGGGPPPSTCQGEKPGLKGSTRDLGRGS